MSITETQAKQLFARLRTSFLSLEIAIKEIKETKAWEALGFTTFEEAWKQEMSGLKVPAAAEAYLAYHFLDEGSDLTGVITGVGPAKAEKYREAKSLGIPVDKANIYARQTTVRAHTRRKPIKRNAITVEGFTDEQINRWREYANDNNLDFLNWCRSTLEEALESAVQ